MAIEIERKFLLANDDWRALVSRSDIMQQAYLNRVEISDDASTAGASVRVRIVGARAWLNLKAAKRGLSRAEFEYEIPLTDAQSMLSMAIGRTVEKKRHYVELNGLVWEIDEFEGCNQGLLVAELELQSEQQTFVRPNWLGREISTQLRYYNASLAIHPYSQWTEQEK